MVIKIEKGRMYCTCNECGKPYSFKVGKLVWPGMKDYCREHGECAYPLTSKEEASLL